MFVERLRKCDLSEAEKEVKEGKVVPRRRERLQLKQQGDLQRTSRSWRTSKRTLDKPVGDLLRRGPPASGEEGNFRPHH
jgi:hypothetical protein